MTKLFKLISFAAILGISFVDVASADPLAAIGNNFTQNRIGTSVSDQNLNTVVGGSVVANGSAGNTISVVEAKSGDGFATFSGNNFLQQEIGSTYANQTGFNIVGSSVANNAAGNAITFSGQ